MTRLTALVAATAIALAAAGDASAKMVPRFDRAQAKPGTVVRVSTTYAQMYKLPIRFMLIPVGHGGSRVLIATYTRRARMSFTFRVPRVPPGRYTVEVWFGSSHFSAPSATKTSSLRVLAP